MVDDKQTLKVIQTIRALGGWVIAVVMIVLSTVFWIQNSGDDKYYSRIKGEQLEKIVDRFDKKMDLMDDKNSQILEKINDLKTKISVYHQQPDR